MNADDEPDTALLDAVRGGDLGAYEVLFRRHVEQVRRAARCYGAEPAEQQDLVAETFARVLVTLRRGSGPRGSLRPYLLVTVRNLAARWRFRQGRVDRYRTTPELAEASTALTVEGCDETALRHWTADVVSSAFRALPERWRTVLWHLEINGTTPAELAPLLGLSPNGVSSLAVRAREGLRRAYLQAQVPHTREPSCQRTRQRIGSWFRGDLSPRRAALVAEHLDECSECHHVTAGLVELNHELRTLARPPYDT